MEKKYILIQLPLEFIILVFHLGLGTGWIRQNK